MINISPSHNLTVDFCRGVLSNSIKHIETEQMVSYFTNDIFNFILLKKMFALWFGFQERLFLGVLLTHRTHVAHICVRNLSHHCFREWLAAVGAKPLSDPKLNYFNWTFRNKLQGHINRNSNLFNDVMHFKMSPVEWWPFCLCHNLLMISQHWFR